MQLIIFVNNCDKPMSYINHLTSAMAHVETKINFYT